MRNAELEDRMIKEAVENISTVFCCHFERSREIFIIGNFFSRIIICQKVAKNEQECYTKIMDYKLCSPYAPTGDQPEAIDTLCEGLRDGLKHQVLLGVTGVIWC